MKSAARGYSAPAFDQGIFLLHLNKGRQALKAGDIARAREHLEESLKLRPRDEMALNLLGMVYFRLELRKEAAAVYRELISLHPEADILHSNLGILEFKEGRHEAARLELEEALRINPRNPKPHLYLGLIAKLSGHDQECLSHLRQAGVEALAARLDAAASDSAGHAPALSTTRPETPKPDPRGGDVVAFARRGGPVTGPAHSASPPAWATLDLREAVESREKTRSLVGESLFALKGEKALEVAFLSRIGVRSGSAILASGEMDSSVELPGFLMLGGPGRVLLAAKGFILLLPLSAQRIVIDRPRALAWEGCLQAADAEAGPGGAASIRLSGSGILALNLAHAPLVIEIRREHTLRLDASRVAAWTDGVRVSAEQSPGAPLMADGHGVVIAEGSGQILMDVA